MQPSFASVTQLQHPVDDKSPSKELVDSDNVWVYNACRGSKPQWLEGTVVERLGSKALLSNVSATYSSCVCVRHEQTYPH